MNSQALKIILFCLVVTLSRSSALAERPFRLMTIEAAENPQATGVAGLQELGATIGPLFIDTNPLYDLAMTGNAGVKLVRPITDELSATVGARYLSFFGSSVVEQRLKQAESRIDSFKLVFQGATASAGLSLRGQNADYHVNAQWADISGSRVFNTVLAASLPFSAAWAGVAEAGYDFANKQSRASLGITRTGQNFGLRLGATYVKISDPLLTYNGVVPVIDFFWLFGGSANSNRTLQETPAAATSPSPNNPSKEEKKK